MASQAQALPEKEVAKKLEELTEKVTLLEKENTDLRSRVAELEGRAVPAEVSKPELAPTSAPYPVADWIKCIRIDGKSFLRYSYELEDSRDDFNEFDLDRLYVGFHWQLWDEGSLHYILDAVAFREDGDQQFDLTTKYFYLEVKDLLYPSTYLHLGQADLPWVVYEEIIWTYRFQGTVFADRSGYLTSTDLGAAFGGEIPDGWGSWQVNVANGEGWDKSEIGKHKDFHGRITVKPLAFAEGPYENFFVTGFGSVGAYDDIEEGPDDRERAITQIGYKEPDKITLAAEYLWAWDPAVEMKRKYPSLAAREGDESRAQGISIFGVLNLNALVEDEFAKRWELVARWDRLDPDEDIEDNTLDRLIGGVSYRWNEHIRTLLDYEMVDYESDALLNDERRIMFQSEIVY